MDCASCVTKIENALARIDGVRGVQVNYTAERLTFRLVDTAPDIIEAKIRALGNRPGVGNATRLMKPPSKASSKSRNDAGQDFLDALERLKRRARLHPTLKKLAAQDRLRINISTVAQEAGRSRTPIGTENCRYPEIRADILALPAPQAMSGRGRGGGVSTRTISSSGCVARTAS